MSFNILLIIAATVVVFLILREVVCWYFKINERVKLQAESNCLQKGILQELVDMNSGLKAPQHTKGLSMEDRSKALMSEGDATVTFFIDDDGVKRYN
jgi:hypothetical protein